MLYVCINLSYNIVWEIMCIVFGILYYLFSGLIYFCCIVIIVCCFYIYFFKNEIKWIIYLLYCEV